MYKTTSKESSGRRIFYRGNIRDCTQLIAIRSFNVFPRDLNISSVLASAVLTTDTLTKKKKRQLTVHWVFFMCEIMTLDASGMLVPLW